MDSLKTLIQAYEKWVAANPETVCDVETTTKWVSYFIAGRISNSNVVSELFYSLSNLLVLYNDRIIDMSRGQLSAGERKSDGVCYRLKVMLTTLEYCEVFIEISAKRLFGQKGKWLFIAMVQLLKAVGRFFILKHSTDHIITSPALPNLNRRTLLKQQKSTAVSPRLRQDDDDGGDSNKTMLLDEKSFTFQLKRSGRTIRKVEGAPPLQYRSFKLKEELEEAADRATERKVSRMPKELIHAEYLYIAKPLIHLAAMSVLGTNRWKQFAISLSLDLLSIRMYHKNRHLMNKSQKLEMSRRCINLLMYLVRSPFYERFTQSRLDRLLGFVTDNIPIVKMVAGPLREYIPHWQSTYFYLWST